MGSFAFMLTYYSLDQCSNCFTAATSPIRLSVYLILLPSLINKILQLLNLGLGPGVGTFSAWGPRLQTRRCTPSYIPHYPKKQKNKTEMRFWGHQMWEPSATWFCLEILSIKIMNKMFKRYSVSCICYWWAISLQLTSLKLASIQSVCDFMVTVINW